jgi:hypothetical protein
VASAAYAQSAQPIGADRTAICGLDRGLISPSGSHILFIRDLSVPPHAPSGGASSAIYDARCLSESREVHACLRREIERETDLSVSGAAWLDGDGLAIWGRRTGLETTATVTGPLRYVAPTSGRRFAIQGAVSSQRLADAIARDYSAAEFRTLIVTRNEGALTLDADRSGFIRYRSDDGSVRRQTRVQYHSVSRVVGASGGGAELNGGVLLIGGRDLADAARHVPNASFITDATSGLAIGFAAPPGQISLPGYDHEEGLLSRVVEADLRADAALSLRHIDINLAKHSAVISYMRALDARGFRILQWGQAPRSRLLTCARSDALGWTHGTVQFHRIGGAGWPLGGVTIRGRETPTGLAILLTGGPIASAYSLARSVRWNYYLDRRFEVFAPFVSGNTELSSAGLNRLRRDPVSALTRDAAALADFVRGRVQGSRLRTVIHAESFGAGLALELAKLLDDQDVDVVLTSPWLAYRAPADWAEDVAYQLAFEQQTLGFPRNRRAYFRWIDRLLSDRDARSRLLVIFGAREDRVDVAAVENARGRVVVLDNLSHETVTVAPSTWDLVTAFLAEREARSAGQPR